VFRFIKEKNIFESVYRRMLIDRIIFSYLDYDPTKEDSILESMERECGDDWSKDIKAIGELFLKDREKMIKDKAIAENSPQLNLKIGGLVPLIVPEDSWPFEDKNSKIQLHP